jgi:hypothetical protein
MGAENVASLGFDPWTVQPVASRCTDYISCNLLYIYELSMYICLQNCHFYFITILAQGKLPVPRFSLSCDIHQLDLCFLGALVKLQKGTISFIMSVFLRLSICMEQRSSHWMDFYEI